MAYDLELEKRIDGIVDSWDVRPVKKSMFGGIGYLVGGNMAFGVHGTELLIRTDTEQGDKLLENNGVRHFEMGGRKSMKNWYLVNIDKAEGKLKLSCFLEISLDYAQSLPVKK
ncbi:MAG TPA: TfoX/Sxy family protein [Candidatus Saccharimonadales bacterium]|nr:TfoX/Sxy family protein [Candidatus Saccharimonadales bacterium]